MLVQNKTIEAIKTGEISVMFRRWRRPGAKAGGTQMTQGGVIGIDSVEVVSEAEITDLEARQAGFASREDLMSHLAYRADDIYRLRVSWVGEDPRTALRAETDLSKDELQDIVAKLRKLDRNSPYGAWTVKFLTIIRDRPATLAAKLAAQTGLETAVFKPMVRKLKALGLTESLEIGYRLSPRGEKVLAEFVADSDVF